MRIGSRVAVSRMNPDGDYTVPDDNVSVGTVIELHNECNRDGYDFLEAVTIRWDDGKVEKKELAGEDAISDWELYDVTPTCYANLYLHDRAYGGPEEGGWWYDTYSPVDEDWLTDPPPHGHFPTEAEARAAFELLKAWAYNENQSRRSPSSVASEGHFTVVLESWPAEFSPKQRPHYC